MPTITVDTTESEATARGSVNVKFDDGTGNGYLCRLVRFRADGGAWRFVDWKRLETGKFLGGDVTTPIPNAPAAFTTNASLFFGKVADACRAQDKRVTW